MGDLKFQIMCTHRAKLSKNDVKPSQHVAEISQSYPCNPRNQIACISQSQSTIREVRINCGIGRHGSRGGEMGEFSPLLFLSPLLSSFFSYPSNIEIIFDFSDFSDRGGENSPPPFQNPGSASDRRQSLE